MFVHGIEFCPVGFILVFFVVLWDLLEAVIFDFFDDSVDGDDEIEEEDEEDDNLKEDRVDVEGAGHGDGAWEGGHIR